MGMNVLLILVLCYVAARRQESKRNSGIWSLRPGWLQVSDCFLQSELFVLLYMLL